MSETAPTPDPSVWPAETLRSQARALDRLADAVAGPQARAFSEAVDLIIRRTERGGTFLVSGLGKSGLVGQKIAATFASLGIPSHSVHPSEAAHGDLGRFRESDTVLCLSNSGETGEIVDLAAILRQDQLAIIAITGRTLGAPPSSLERLATVSLRLGIEREAGEPMIMAPTSSTTAAMALGDALALETARRRQFTPADFARRHPGGALGGLLRPVTEAMRFKVGVNLTPLAQTMSVAEALRAAATAARRPGALLLIDPASGLLAGIFTDGDLRRLILNDPSRLAGPISGVMTRSPRALRSDALVRDAVALVREHRADEVPVIDHDGRPVGLLDVQDLIALRLVQE